ncbi:hypothetical protein [Xenorhabdus szentirmaii]|uniref:Uncharacterized protein n=1 Tax=Xenorhabdus szentirmaii DSM 16338 TaxID=1427518 RepID=W1J1P4_9GAMM|nr:MULTISPECIES: hypothetical protein [Xenorhabdus]MBD2793230.1 hypothetical protein [Xenorhabdus sp. CUL]MBD2820080.1 hypothetical protein [Xenorhabdus sp. 42]PHM35471.1 hypothetical protein Xsze_01942 [Xenorhabdus szentirmaii DSM 16338]PHM44287.1 hypothetical protein Xszus_04117 [Xenorhabdus szentirmaii]CDL84667.1 hypothetical protein XSR1_50069 [Xenorhabdus szentirmaii DSM 16338]
MQTLLLVDLDGTLIDTPHYEAWRNAARQIGAGELTHEEYLVNIAGRPRLEGASRLLELKKDGLAVDISSNELAEIKQAEFLRLSVDARLFDDALRLLKRIEISQQCVKFYTASQNAADLFRAMLHKADLSLEQRNSVQSNIVQINIVQQGRDQTREALFLELIKDQDLSAVTLIDDSPHSVDVACHLGIRAYQIHRNELLPVSTDPRARIIRSFDDISIPILDTPIVDTI